MISIWGVLIYPFHHHESDSTIILNGILLNHVTIRNQPVADNDNVGKAA